MLAFALLMQDSLSTSIRSAQRGRWTFCLLLKMRHLHHFVRDFSILAQGEAHDESYRES